MSNLYIRLFTGFYSHRKTMKLHAILGDDAYWVVPRIWAYAAENQADGNLSGYSSHELAMLIGCPKHATSIIDALKTSGYLDADGMIHDWQEHNGYHSAFKERAKKAAEARWAGKRTTGINKEKDNDIEDSSKHCLEHATSIFNEYPRKVNKKKALQSIQKALKLEPYESLLEKTKEFAGLMTGKEPQYIPYPTTWFNGERWHDNESVRLEMEMSQPVKKYTPNL
jgi:hypothetical protein